MAITCGGTLIKILLGLFNFAWLAIGSFIIYLGVRTLQFNKDDYLKDLINANLQTGALVLVVFGSVIALVAFLGFFGACCESSVLLNVYAAILLVLLVTNCVGIYFGYRYQDQFKEEFGKGVKNGITDGFNTQNSSAATEKLAFALQNIQSMMQCCGWEGPADYSSIEIPASCCKESFSLQEPQKTCARTSIQYKDGCKDSPVINTLKNSIWFSAYALIMIQVIVILAACCLVRDLSAYQRVNTSD